MPSVSKRTKKRHYERSTPVTRLRRNVEKILRHAALSAERLGVWAETDQENFQIRRALDLLGEVTELARKVDELVVDLEELNYVPVRKSAVWQPADGELVRVVGPYRPKFEAIYAEVLKTDPAMLDELVVQSTLPSGDIVVRRGKRTPFSVRKSHIQPAARS